MNESPPFFAKAIAILLSETDCMMAETNGMLSCIPGAEPFLNLTSGVVNLTLSGEQSFVVRPGINKYSLNVLEISLIMCGMLTVLRICKFMKT